MPLIPLCTNKLLIGITSPFDKNLHFTIPAEIGNSVLNNKCLTYFMHICMRDLNVCILLKKL